MTTIAGHGEVGGISRGERSHNRRFRTIGKMGVAAHGTGMFEKRALDVLLEFTNPRHLGVDPDQPIVHEDVP